MKKDNKKWDCGAKSFNSSCPRNMEEFGNGRKNARTFLKFQSLFYNYLSINFNIQLKKVRVSQNSSFFFGLDFGLM